MNSLSNHFGLMVAYLLPGFIGLAAIAPFVPVVADWLQPFNQQASLGPPVYALLAATTVGMVLSCVRWLLIDHLHHLMGIRPPVWNDRALADRVAAFNYLVDNHYRYYQFYSLCGTLHNAYYADRKIMRTSCGGRDESPAVSGRRRSRR
jgi:hypothetical protein